MRSQPALGDAIVFLLDLGRPGEARTSFDRALWRAANRSLSVLGLARASSQLGQRVEAQRYYRQFLSNWQKADVDLPELKEARGHAAAPR